MNRNKVVSLGLDLEKKNKGNSQEKLGTNLERCCKEIECHHEDAQRKWKFTRRETLTADPEWGRGRRMNRDRTTTGLKKWAKLVNGPREVKGPRGGSTVTNGERTESPSAMDWSAEARAMNRHHGSDRAEPVHSKY